MSVGNFKLSFMQTSAQVFLYLRQKKMVLGFSDLFY